VFIEECDCPLTTICNFAIRFLWSFCRVTIFLSVLVALQAPVEAQAKTKDSSAHKTSKGSSARAVKSVPAIPFSTVVIDAGHGGYDRGGIPQNIIQEKNVTLDVALRLGKSLSQAGFNTVMTRSDDRFVSLGTRVATANAQRNAIFMCIHFNSGLRIGARGIETFYASSSEAPLAARIQRNLMRTTSGDNRGIKRASFYVLKRTTMRAVLAECGFLTNPQDAALAQNSGYRQKLADQITAAIVEERNSL
jgi:N-acetylmuramoyl-L-alanine amidase